MDTFTKAINRVLTSEGGYLSPEAAKAQGDPGGETNWGISKRSYPSVDIKNLTRDQAIAIYRRDFWDRVGGDSLPPAIGFQVLDAAVNSGVGQSIRWLQSAAGVAPDGNYGPVSKAAVAATSPEDLVLLFIAARLDFMTRLNNWAVNAKGWVRRMVQDIRFAAEDDA